MKNQHVQYVNSLAISYGFSGRVKSL